MKMISDKDEVRRTGPVKGLPAGAAKDSRAEDYDGDDRKRVILAVAVTVTTLVIVAAWLVTLPMQLDGFRILDDDSVARWYVIREEVNQEAGGIQEQLDRLKSQLDEAAAGLENTSDRSDEAAGGVLIPTDIAGRLRNKIMGAGSINQTEQDATTQENE